MVKPRDISKRFTSATGWTAAVLLALGQAYLRLKLYDKAAARLEEMIRLTPDSAKAHLLLGEALDNTSEPERAMLELRRAIELDAQLKEAHYALGYSLAKKGET